MELRDYVMIIGKRFWLLIITIVLILVSTIIFTMLKPISYDATVTLDVLKKADNNQANYFQYDKYYAEQASSMYADSIMSWLKDPTAVLTIANNGNIDLNNPKLKNLTKLISTRKMQTTSVQIDFINQDKSVAQNFLSSTVKYINTKNENLNKLDPSNNFIVVTNESNVFEIKPSLMLNSLVSLIVGIIFGLFMVYIVEYFSKSKK